MPYRHIERDDGSSYTVWEADAGADAQKRADTGRQLNRFTDDEAIFSPPEAPIPPEPESVINERIRLQSGGVNGCTTFGCLFVLMMLAIAICGALYFLPYL